MLQVIWNSVVDNIPWWGYVLAAAVALGFLYPYAAPIWAILPRWLKAALIAIGGLFTAYIAGRNRGAANARLADKERNEQAYKRRTDVNQRVDTMKPSEVDAELDKKGDFID